MGNNQWNGRSEEESRVDDAVDGLLAVEERTQDEFEGSRGHIALLEQAVDPVVVVQLHVDGVAAVDGGGLQVGQELESLPVEGVDVGVEDFSLEGGVADEQVDAVDVVSAFRGGQLFGVVVTVVFLESLIELRAHVHHLDGHAHVLLVVVCISSQIPLAISSLSVNLFIFLVFGTETTLSIFARWILRALGSGTSLSHSLGSKDFIQEEISRK